MKQRSREALYVERLPRLDLLTVRERLLPFCRLKRGEVWEDKERGHRIGVLDATSPFETARLFGSTKVDCFINDPPYNFAVGGKASKNLFKMELKAYLEFSERWVQNALNAANPDCHFYVWLGMDVKNNFQPLPDFMLLMRQFKKLKPRNFITWRKQRGYGTQHNWMWLRQELLHYICGRPFFRVVYTEIPKVLKGYYKTVGGRLTENLERSRAATIRPGNVWIDIQQVFYRLEENMPGCYAQKPLKAITRLLEASTQPGQVVADLFAHAGTTLIAGELLGRRVLTADIDEVFAELTIRRLLHLRATGKTGFQWASPFPELDS